MAKKEEQEKEPKEEKETKIDRKFSRRVKGTLLKKEPKRMDDLILMSETLTKDDKKIICNNAPDRTRKWLWVGLVGFIVGIIVYIGLWFIIFVLPNILSLF